MALKTSKSLQPSNSTDALFRAWTKFIFDAMVTTGGWTQTADTGQINFTTVTRPLAINTAMGYVILEMADSKQATTPIVVRLDFGSSNASASTPAVWITIGSASDGAGTILNQYFSSPTSSAAPVRAGSNSAVATSIYSFASCDTSRAMIALFVGAASGSFSLVFSIERTRTASGGDGTTGVLLCYSQSGNFLDRANFINVNAITQPPQETALPFILSGRSPSARSEQVGVGIPFHFDGLAQQPGTAWLVVTAADIGSMGRYNISVYNSMREYQHLGVFGIRGWGGTGGAQLLMRAD
jgi:hypothetical protein